jgi:sarcosine oxidase subunit gamma
MNPPRHEPLAGLALARGTKTPDQAAGVTLRALPHQPSVILRGDSGNTPFVAAFRAALGFELPLSPNRVGSHDDFTALWLGPSEWLVLGEGGGERLAGYLAGYHHAIVPNGDGQQIIALAGARARGVLAKLCPLDLASPDLDPGRCARSLLARCTMLLHPQTGGAYHIHIPRSLADYAWRSLVDAGQEFGVAVVADEV